MLSATDSPLLSPGAPVHSHYSSFVSYRATGSLHSSRASRSFSPVSARNSTIDSSVTPHLAYKQCIIPESPSGISISIVEDLDSSTEYIVKSSRQPLGAEYAIQKSLEGRNITRTKGYFFEGGRYHIVMEYCHGLDLFTYLEGKEVGEAEARKLFRQLVDAVETCHKAGVVHLDIKPENCFIDAHGILKLGDFGFARVMSAQEQVHDYCTLEYMSPEVHMHSPFDGFKADVFAAGKILFELALGFTPFNTATNADKNFSLFSTNSALYWATKRQHIERAGFPVAWNPLLLDLLEKMMARKAECRPNISEVRQHAWLHNT